mmetsp:Transcript_3040/g.3375  ORF Transcript_3040/g.3375 Transcript_3040/m.3375 type:complete len:92 (-) Transcript_3040:72-347(-)
MLNPHMNPLLQNPSIDKLVDSDSNGTLGHVKDNSGTTVVVFVGHTLVDGGVGEDVDVVTDFDLEEVLGEVDGTVLAEFFGKHVPGPGADSK